MRPDLDEHGQPNPALGRERVLLRSIDELLGLCKGVVCDGVVNDVEVVAFHEWLSANQQIANIWPASSIADRLRAALADGIIEEVERQELKEIMEAVAGGVGELITRDNRSIRSAFTDPAPTVFFEDHAFCFSGRFAYGPRIRCEKAVSDRGGYIHETVLKDTQYLVIGTFGSRDWLHSTHGNKIKKAVEKGVCSTISEDVFVEALSA
jgi:NAD-dependent DNA ligase